jgi:hypothetical protein
MEDVLSNEKEDTLCRQNLLAALQKLSLRLEHQNIFYNILNQDKNFNFQKKFTNLND